MSIQLPIDFHLEQIARTFERSQVLLLEAPPGTGKTTRVPASLAFDYGLKTIVLEPRRIAARQAALRVASERGFTHGQEVGHAFRDDKSWSKDTRLLYATEGTFLHLLADKSFDFDVVILDEFHERHLDSDIALALLSCRQEKILVMSATMQGLSLNEHFKKINLSVETIKVDSPLFPLEVRYLENRPQVLNRSLSAKVLDAISEVFPTKGDILIFLSGVREIEELETLLEARYPEILILKLHGKLSIAEQSRVFSPNDKRKIILSTNVAESSLTVPGVRIVIDSGLAREKMWSAWSGLETLQDVKIVKASAIQRAGRAAREGKGLCYRLYSEQDFMMRADALRSEISKSPLDEVYLRLMSFDKPYLWFEAPSHEAWEEARLKLEMLGAIGEDHKDLSAMGGEMAKLPLSPSWARVVLEARECNQKSRDALYKLLFHQIGESSKSLKARIEKTLGAIGQKDECLERLLLSGFVHSLAKVRERDVITRTGRTLTFNQNLAREFSSGEWGLIFEADQTGRIHSFFSIDLDWLYELEPLPFTEKRTIEYDRSKGFTLSDTLKVGSLTVENSNKKINISQIPSDLREMAQALLHKERAQELGEVKKETRWARLCYAYEFKFHNIEQLNQHVSEFLDSGLDFDVESFFSYLEQKFIEVFGRSINELLPWQIGELKIHYEIGSKPYIMTMIQYLYGLKETPHLLLTREPLLLKILGPHKRPIQVTDDLKGFWKRGYVELLKEMRREYPRHHWPDEPECAPALLLKRHLAH